MDEKNWLIIVDENMDEACAYIAHVDNAFPLDGWERIWDAYWTKEEAIAALTAAKEYARGRAYPPY